ncbi:MAG: PAS domain-containing protein [Parvibaculum sp.]|nr:PAS domain-containing protein [Parvibaculum sp.]|tara:strand:- start:2919 stop:3419 length:501 start_codon:yes stop_codon:yes gene_type:complete
MLTELGPHEGVSEINYDVTEVDLPSHPKNQFLLSYWRGKQRADGFVYRSDIAPAELKMVLGGMFIVEATDDGHDLLYRLVGSQNEQRLGMRYMGKRFTECFSAEMAEHQIAFHKRVFESGTPAFLRGHLLGIDLEYVEFETSYLPMRREDGVFQMLGGMYDLAEKA